jgi:hypothetical protein
MKCRPSFMRMMITAGLLALVVGLPTSSQASDKRHRSHMLALIKQIQVADFESNRSELERLYTEFEVPAENDLAVAARYWRGFAMWRRAINGNNDGIDRRELDSDYRRAIGEFQQAIALDDTFVDAKIGAASCLLNLYFIHRNDPGKDDKDENLTSGIAFYKEAEQLASDNPRFLWIRGGSLWFRANGSAEGQREAVASYEKGLDLARRQKNKDALLPSWGEPELLMSIAWAKLNQASPDPRTAKQFAQKALKLVPNWHFVRDILLPQIETELAKQKADSLCSTREAEL